MPPHSSSAGTNESISLTNGSVNLYVPLLSLPQRGGYSLNLGYVHHSNALSPIQKISVNGAIYNQSVAPQGNFVIQHITYSDTFGTLDNQLEINLPRLQISTEFMGDKPYYSSGAVIYHTEVSCETNFAFTDWEGNRHGFVNVTNCNTRYGANPIAQTPIDLTDATDVPSTAWIRRITPI